MHTQSKSAVYGIYRHYRASELAALLGVSVPTVWRWSKIGRLPKGRQLSPGVTAWDGVEIAEWLAQRDAA